MSYLLNEISWYDYQDKIKNQHILIIPIGATEQHGPHLPLGVDAMLAKAFSLALAKQINGVVAPTLNYGYKSLPLSGGGPFFPGTIDLNGNTLIQLTKDIVNEFARDGWKHIVIFNCHYERSLSEQMYRYPLDYWIAQYLPAPRAMLAQQRWPIMTIRGTDYRQYVPPSFSHEGDLHLTDPFLRWKKQATLAFRIARCNQNRVIVNPQSLFDS